MLKKLAALFTPARRKAIYICVSAGAMALLAFGVITQDQLNALTQNAAAVIAFLATLMAAINTNTAA